MNQSQRSGREKNRVKKRGVSVSDMKLSAHDTAGRTSSHPPPCPTHANGGGSSSEFVSQSDVPPAAQ